MANRHLHRILFGAVALIVTLSLIVAGVVQAEFGTGWTAQYFNNTTLAGTPVYTESLPAGINFNWGTGSPHPSVPVDNFSARFTSVQFFNAGVYEFVAASDDGIRVYIDNVLVLDRFFGRVLTTDRFQQTMTQGTHTLTVEYLELIDQAAVQFQWFAIQLTPTALPTTVFGSVPFVTPGPTPTVYTGPLATVTGVRGLALRTGPYLGASFITTLVGGQSYPVIARNEDEGFVNWYLLDLGDRRGWASGRYLQLNIDRNLLPVVGSVFDEIDNAPDLNVVAITRAVMNIRRRPSTRTEEIGEIPWGGYASVIGRTVQAGTDRWYQVRYNGIVGWIAAPWVTIQGERFAVPVR